MEKPSLKRKKEKDKEGTVKLNKKPKSKSEANTFISPFVNKFGSPVTIETKKIKNKSADRNKIATRLLSDEYF